MWSFFAMIFAFNSSYFVEWIPNNATVPPPPRSDTDNGEWPWQL